MRRTKAFVGLTNHRENRSDKRLLSPGLEISFDGGSYQTTDWSLGGVRVAGYYGQRTPGDEVEGTVQVLSDTNSHPFKAVVVRRDSGELALIFTELSNSALLVLLKTASSLLETPNPIYPK